MLRDLHVRNLAVLAEVRVEFGSGLNILTGETGAGKSIVVDSLALLAGARASNDLIRTGADELTVAGVFQPAGEVWRRALEEAGLGPEGGEIVVRREISREGRNRVFLDDQPVTLRLLSEVAPELLRIHTQREELGLISPEVQRAWLDRSGGPEAEALRARTAETFEAYRRLADRLERLSGDERLRQERADLLRFQIGEIGEARLAAGEEEELRREREVLRHSEAIREALGSSFALLFDDEGAAGERLARSRQLLEGIASWERGAAAWAEELAELRIRLDELSRSLGRRLDEVEADPRRLDAVEGRLATIERLCRKYGETTAEVLAYRERAAAELAELQGDEEGRDRLEGEVREALEAYGRAARELSRGRACWGDELASRVRGELQDLALAQARFAVRLEPRRRAGGPLTVGGEAVEISPQGIDQVTYLFSPNPGEELRPLAKIASGGELSRVYLALQLAARGEGRASGRTLVFDEVDAGIGGSEAAALGRKLKRLARGGQILAVTHLPQVASHADRHFKVRKRVEGGRTWVDVVPLDGTGRVDEVARMLAGKKVTSLSRSHAQELIAGAERGAG